MKQQRQYAIRELLDRSVREGSTIASQDDLRLKLLDRGHRVTQATLSRDLREMRLAKGPAGYSAPGTDPDDDLPAIAELFQTFGQEVRPAGNLLVVLTITGGAQPVAAGIDGQNWPEVVGTIAGDNTVLIICPDAATAKNLKLRIDSYLE